jgi:hypothetical protein
MVPIKITKALAALALIGLVGVTACDDSETERAPMGEGAEQAAPMPGQGQEMDPETMALMSEVQELQQRLQPIQEEAMQDQELNVQLQDLQQRVETAMRQEAPELLDRMDGLEEDFMAAQADGDQERVQEIAMEAQGVEMEIQAVQSQVLEQPELQESLDAFQAAQRERMNEIDPEAGAMLDRLEEIYAELQIP